MTAIVASPEQLSLMHGWALFGLGRPAESAEILDRQAPGIPATSRRARARFNTRRALAHACSGQIDHACSALARVLDDALQVDSATIRVDLRQLARILARWGSHATVHNIYPDLVRVCRSGQQPPS